MRDYSKIDKYLDKLGTEIYAQPQDDGHSALALDSIKTFLSITGKIRSVLDLGCGEGFCQEYFEERGIIYAGVCLHRDYDVAKSNKKNVFNVDFSFLPFGGEMFDLLYSRHSLEHSPMPLMTLMEWYEVTKKYLAIVVPTPTFWGFGGRNHYFVLNREQWKNLFAVSGFDVVFEDVKKQDMTPNKNGEISEIEYWFLLEKK